MYPLIDKLYAQKETLNEGIVKNNINSNQFFVLKNDGIFGACIFTKVLNILVDK